MPKYIEDEQIIIIFKDAVHTHKPFDEIFLAQKISSVGGDW